MGGRGEPVICQVVQHRPELKQAAPGLPGSKKPVWCQQEENPSTPPGPFSLWFQVVFSTEHIPYTLVYLAISSSWPLLSVVPVGLENRAHTVHYSLPNYQLLLASFRCGSRWSTVQSTLHFSLPSYQLLLASSRGGFRWFRVQSTFRTL